MFSWYFSAFIFLLIWQVNCINFELVYDLLIFNCDWTEIFDRVFLKSFLFPPGVWPKDHESPSLMIVAFNPPSFVTHFQFEFWTISLRHLWKLLTWNCKPWPIRKTFGEGEAERDWHKGTVANNRIVPPSDSCFLTDLPFPRCAKLSKNSSLNGGRRGTPPPLVPWTIFLFKL